ncbi:unnamed protein product [Tuber melanosporum]|uniref:(Perigord truffle) hypothetical protein n=1 Tax=Tuber melanosporum (strain Mel28) TaxID=656061 RepID=D5GAE3_TUBMM|nr:uncharacterized protein GSTUM_00005125001 [Tuber melanosporum]CAZ81400.1 unnamed protein product [Tuber melanosporum]
MLAPLSTRIGHSLAWFLQIDLNLGHDAKEAPIPRVVEGDDGGGLGTSYIEYERYNLKWLYGDLVTGITVECVIIPQGMAYAKITLLPVEFDISISPVAVMSTLVSNILSKAPKNSKTFPYLKDDITSFVALVCGGIVSVMGLLLPSFNVEYITLIAIISFMTSSAISIATGQVCSLLGLSGFNTCDPTYKGIINILKHLHTAQLDVAMGLTTWFLLHLIHWNTSTYLQKRYPSHKKKSWFFISTLRTAFPSLLYTVITWLVNRGHAPKKVLFKIFGTVPSGFKPMGVQKGKAKIFKVFIDDLQGAVIVLLLSILYAILNSFGRINNYYINPSQELIAIGSKADVRTPFAGSSTGIVILLAIYLLTSVDLITPLNAVYKFWCISPLEVVVFFAGVIVMVFTSIENGIYVTIALSAGVMLFRIAKVKGCLLGKVQVRSATGASLYSGSAAKKTLGCSLDDNSARNIYLPLDLADGSNPSLRVVSPYPGIFIYRFSEGFVYTNASHYTENLRDNHRCGRPGLE